MYELYIGNKNYSSWSLRPWLLMQHLGIPFKERLVPFGDGAVQSFSPSGKVPCLVDDGCLVWDSLSITEYLAERHDSVWPSDAGSRAWARCAAAEMHSGFGALREHCTMNLGIRVRINDFSSELTCDLARIDTLWQEGLECFGGPFLSGEVFSAVDAHFAPVAFRLEIYGIELSSQSNEYAARLRDLEPMRAWCQAALEERWRDQKHEEEALRAGQWIEDRRLG